MGDWDYFLGNKKRTAQSHYSEGRRCQNCRTFITNLNESGCCKPCLKIRAREEDYGIEPRTYIESEAHKQLKDIAIDWLFNEGAHDAKKEVKAKGKLGAVIFDAAGHKNGDLIVVECGGNQKRKLSRALAITSHIYLLPYNHVTPQRYNGEHRCSHCGNLMECQVKV